MESSVAIIDFLTLPLAYLKQDILSYPALAQGELTKRLIIYFQFRKDISLSN